MPASFRFVAAYGPLLLVESDHAISRKELAALRRLPGIQAASLDNVVLRPLGDHDAGKKTPEAKRAPEPCTLMERCPNGKPKFWAQDVMMAPGMHSYMQTLGISESTDAQVAVVDSGFDGSQEASFESKGGVHTDRGAKTGEEHPYKKYFRVSTYKKDVEVLGDPSKDENGHGTMVSSTIAGAGGIGVAKSIHLSVYRVTEPGDAGSTASGYLDMAMLRACRENHDASGLTIINMSWGGRLDESGIKPEEKDEVTQKVLDQLADEGCLVTKAAGNDNFRATRKGDDLDDAYLRVAAIDPTLGLAGFSTSGEIAAPGESIYVRNSNLPQKYLRDAEKLCGKESNTRFVNGTSFAAPFAAGIASQIVRVLKATDALKALSNRDRIKLVNRILRASMQMGSINGLRAVAIAHVWATQVDDLEKKKALAPSTAKDSPGVTFLTNLLERFPAKICEESHDKCEKKIACTDTLSCLADEKAQVALCVPPDAAVTEDIARTAFAKEAYELGHYYSSMTGEISRDLKPVRELRKIAVEGYLRSKGYYNVPPPPVRNEYGYTPHVPFDKTASAIRSKIFRNMPANFVQSTLAPYLEDAATLPKGKGGTDILADAADGILSSYEIRKALEMGFDPKTGEDRGSNSVLEAVHSVLKTARRAMGPEAFKKMIANKVDWHLSDKKWDIEHQTLFDYSHSTGQVRILDSLIKDESGGTPMRRFLEGEENRILSSMRQMNEYHGQETQTIVFSIETFPDRPTFSGLLERHEHEAIALAREKGLEALAPIEIEYQLEDSSRTGASASRVEFILDTFDTIASGKGWGPKNDPEIVESILAELSQLKAKVTPTEWRNIEKRFNAILTGAVSADLVGQLLTGHWEDRVFGLDRFAHWYKPKADEGPRKAGLTYQAHPLLGDKVIAMLSHKAAAAIQNADPKELTSMSSRYDLPGGLGLAWKGLTIPVDSSQEITVPVFKEKPLTRLAPKTEDSPRTTTMGAAGFPELLVGATRIAGSKEGSEVGGKILETLKVSNFDMQYSPEIRKLVTELPAVGPWRKEVDGFLTGPETYHTGMAKYYLKDFLTQLDSVHAKEIREAKEKEEQEKLNAQAAALVKEITKAVQPALGSVREYFGYPK